MKIFVLLSRFPYPLEKGDKLRAYHQIRELSKEHEIHLFSLTDIPIKQEWKNELEKYCTSLQVIELNKTSIYWNVFIQLFTGKPFQVGYFFQRRVAKQVKKSIQDIQPDHIYCQLIRTAEYVKEVFSIPKTIDYMDALSKGMERRMDNASGFRKMMYRSEYRRLLKYEHLIFDYFDHHTIISEQDKKHIYHQDQNKIKVIPNGVSESFFEDIKASKEFTLVFTGNMNYAPNVNGAVYLANQILPLLRKSLPQASLLIAGANPHKSVRDLSNEYIEVSGWVEDMRKSICSGEIYVAPMQIGSGVQNKLLEAMSLGIPCITSPLANKGLQATPDKHIVIADDPELYVKQVLKLLNEETFKMNISKNGREFVEKNFSWDSSTKMLVQLLKPETLKETKR